MYQDAAFVGIGWSGDSRNKYLCKWNSINMRKNAINNFQYGTMAKPNGEKFLQLWWTVIRYTTNSLGRRLLFLFPAIAT